ncbi:GDP-L-fucose synthase family protein [Rhizobium sp. CF142]|uniref:GDP-L-fucose synthase family protein n=1 Tax=Rhizobium sp. CF142 TaxID=1144314 RepID=UPI00026EFD4B|nr:GDP-L-fucose synthase [Rhizobium sp. CF142]EJJ28055.1 nucleoside-diphosphate-sugar epimerase [Rhizobium sp. CF142]
MRKSSKIFVAGHRGMVGSAIVRHLLASGCPADLIVTAPHRELDLIEQADVRRFFERERPDQVYLAAARVGGIYANNTYPADFIYDNLMMELNVVDAAFRTGVKKLLLLGSSCIYPKLADQPIKESALLTGPLEPTNEPYAIAKIAGIKLCESYNRQYGDSHDVDYRCIMPSNLYGVGDSYHPQNSHVIPALIRRFHEAKVSGASSVTLWGSGTPMREFLYVDDMAAASVHIMDLPREDYKRLMPAGQSHINVGYGSDVTILEVATLISEIVGFTGSIGFDTTKPDGTPRKLMESEVARNLGWLPIVDLQQGLKLAYEDFLSREKVA